MFRIFKKPKTASELELEKAIRVAKKELLTDQFISAEAADEMKKIIDFAETKLYGSKRQDDNTISMKNMLINSLASEPYECLSIAYLYAKQYLKYGVDVTEKWDTVTKQTEALEKSYHVGYQEALKDIERCENEHKITQSI